MPWSTRPIPDPPGPPSGQWTKPSGKCVFKQTVDLFTVTYIADTATHTRVRAQRGLHGILTHVADMHLRAGGQELFSGDPANAIPCPGEQNTELIYIRHFALPARVTEQLLNGEVDLGFVCLPIPRLDTSIMMHSLPSTPIVAIVPATHPLAPKDKVWLRELGDEPFYLLPTDMMSGFSSEVARLFAQARISPRSIGMAETSNITAQIIANGFGVTLASLSSIESRIDGVNILQLKDAKPDLELGLIYTSVNSDLPLIQGFLGVLTKLNQTPSTSRRPSSTSLM